MILPYLLFFHQAALGFRFKKRAQGAVARGMDIHHVRARIRGIEILAQIFPDKIKCGQAFGVDAVDFDAFFEQILNKYGVRTAMAMHQ